MRKFFTAALLLACSVSLSAAVLIYNDTTAGGPTWNRPLANGNLPPTPPASGVGTAVRYHVFQFEVDTNGAYMIQSATTSPPGWDNYTFLYANTFSPLSPFAGVVIGNDDNPNVGLSGFTVNLVTGTTYFMITTGFSNTDFGAFTNTISGPGLAFATPEPSSLALAALGAAGVLLLRRRK